MLRLVILFHGLVRSHDTCKIPFKFPFDPSRADMVVPMANELLAAPVFDFG